jgi:hypothetical protein
MDVYDGTLPEVRIKIWYKSLDENFIFTKCQCKIEFSQNIMYIAGVMEQGPKTKCIKRSSKYFGDDKSSVFLTVVFYWTPAFYEEIQKLHTEEY